MQQLEPRLILALAGMALLLGGLALAVNFRGVTTRWAQRTVESATPWLQGPLGSVPPWRSLRKRSVEQRVAQQVIRMRVLGVLYAGGGVMVLVASATARSIHVS